MAFGGGGSSINRASSLVPGARLDPPGGLGAVIHDGSEEAAEIVVWPEVIDLPVEIGPIEAVGFHQLAQRLGQSGVAAIDDGLVQHHHHRGQCQEQQRVDDDAAMLERRDGALDVLHCLLRIKWGCGEPRGKTLSSQAKQPLRPGSVKHQLIPLRSSVDC